MIHVQDKGVGVTVKFNATITGDDPDALGKVLAEFIAKGPIVTSIQDAILHSLV